MNVLPPLVIFQQKLDFFGDWWYKSTKFAIFWGKIHRIFGIKKKLYKREKKKNCLAPHLKCRCQVPPHLKE
jgi:hypothetical protein